MILIYFTKINNNSTVATLILIRFSFPLTHKYFVKAPGQKTQRCVSEFAVQTANQCYNHMIVTKHAMTSIRMEMD